MRTIFGSGLSPRTRRNRVRQGRQNARGGSISAHAEEPWARTRRVSRRRVYLRARGGTLYRGRSGAIEKGLSPRTRRNRS
ncbi:Hypothetical protein GbCGDNIH1_8033 [Granulibacter bethesdensis CGDNIH1]|uniref:Uncharacterized protein n=1 Tax=Granulibacter bethesdensis (strain ATCC BAA-1260 / CGDNIH1) TaxID=391165 RepID=A0A286M358_GRABC|nr:Hypothetical protein GbCGDNIH5_8033 [Granulibacter bethesdensis]APH65144.1 Hypothetical protein GbCGDNIH1I4_8033 [Granulibacter bethesdensis]ASV62457.1 Hypothetical protein GbCGDNIH1_8033 [Granulibacter bethesdensis CGDNIH1]